ncbi:hypothetical protein FNV43_RR11515 [Rhamnella rubrinervis]|uniref:Uncharacterized protein n=1 Tax=Rhamnella rubrinervis TaxID=2594499 RepID=A0A8K0H5X4_9ROSA|nr:hypothetical protein FNV43_RR11515 [Rhamnella rubrinervis]
MSGRTFVVIFVFWAFLTIITPTLVLLSETSKPYYLDSNAERSGEGTKARRMMGFTEKHPARPPTLAPSPAPTPTPNRSLGSKKVNYLGKLLSETITVVINRTKLRLI